MRIDSKIIIEKVAAYYGQSPEDLQVETRKREIVKTRQVIMYYAQLFGKLSSGTAASIFGKDHCTALHSKKVVWNDIDSNKDFRFEIAELNNRLNGNRGYKKIGIHYYLMSIYKPESVRICKKCGIEKPLSEFYDSKQFKGKMSKRWSCAKCVSAENRDKYYIKQLAT